MVLPGFVDAHTHPVFAGTRVDEFEERSKGATYQEIAAFVHNASASIANQRFRPRVLARPPRQGNLLLDLRPRRENELRFDGPERAAHYLLEDGQGVRVLDFHGSASTPVHLLKPVGQGPLYLRRASDGIERTVPRVEGLVQLEALPATAPLTRAVSAMPVMP